MKQLAWASSCSAFAGVDHGLGGHRHDRSEHDLGEPATVTGLLHRAGGPVPIAGDDHPVHRAQVQVGQQVAVRQSRHQQQLGVPPVGVAPEGRVGGGGEGGSAVGVQVVIAAVRPVVGRALAPVAGPGRGDRVRVRASHRGTLVSRLPAGPRPGRAGIARGTPGFRGHGSRDGAALCARHQPVGADHAARQRSAAAVERAARGRRGRSDQDLHHRGPGEVRESAAAALGRGQGGRRELLVLRRARGRGRALCGRRRSRR